MATTTSPQGALIASQAETIERLQGRINSLRDQLDDADEKNEQLSDELEQWIGDSETASAQLDELRRELYGWIVLNNAPRRYTSAFGLSEYHAALHDVMDAIDLRIKALDTV